MTLSLFSQVEDAIAKADEEDAPFTLIFMDITMRRVNGNVVTRQLREAGYNKPIVAVTGERRHEHLANAGFNDVRINVLFNRVHTNKRMRAFRRLSKSHSTRSN